MATDPFNSASLEPHTTVVLEKPKLRIRADINELAPEANFQI